MVPAKPAEDDDWVSVSGKSQTYPKPKPNIYGASKREIEESEVLRRKRKYCQR
jgi:hypothetical protein